MNLKLKPSFKIVLTYILFGFFWIIFSDKIIDLIADNKHLYTILQTYKGLFFILFTSILLFRITERHLEKEKIMIVKEKLKLDQINNNINDLFDLSIKMLSPIEYNDEYFIKKYSSLHLLSQV